jgi:hypothetical protein
VRLGQHRGGELDGAHRQQTGAGHARGGVERDRTVGALAGGRVPGAHRHVAASAGDRDLHGVGRRRGIRKRTVKLQLGQALNLGAIHIDAGINRQRHVGSAHRRVPAAGATRHHQNRRGANPNEKPSAREKTPARLGQRRPPN